MSTSDDYSKLVLRDAQGDALATETALLGETLESAIEWRDELVRRLQETEASLSKLRATVDLAEQSARKANTHAAKSAYFRFKAEKEQERSDLIAFKTMITTRLKDVKAIVAEHYRDSGTTRSELRAERAADPNSFESRLDRIEKLLEKLLTQFEEP